MKRPLAISVAATSLLLSACGGGDSNDTPPTTDTAQNTAPTIELVGESNITIGYKDTFVDPGATALDKEDGNLDITTKGTVPQEIGTYTLSYETVDSQGETASITRTVEVVDNVKPSISLTHADMTIETGYQYLEPGFTASDEIDGELSVTVDSNIDTDTPGTYAVTYTATDKANNTTTTTRTVTVTPKQILLQISSFGSGSFELINSSAQLDCEERLCRTFVDSGTKLNVIAVPENGHTLERWNYCDEVSNDTCSITVTEERIIDATFISERPLELANNVIELDEDTIRNITSYDANSGLVIFNANADLSNVNIGDIIISKGIFNDTDDPDNIEIYFARRVTEITGASGTPRFVQTSEVALDEIIVDGTISISKYLTPYDVVAQTLPDGFSIDWKEVRKNEQGTTGDISAQSITIPLEVEVELNRDVAVVGKMSFTINPDVNLDFNRTDGLNELRTIIQTSSTGSLSVVIKGEIEAVEFKKQIGETISMKPIFAGPIVIIPRFNLFFDIGASSEVKVTATGTLGASVTGGAHYLKTTGWKPISASSIKANLSTPNIEAKAAVEVGPRLSTKLYLFGVAGPGLDLKIIGGKEIFPVTTDSTGACLFDHNTYLGGAAKFTGNLKLFTKQYAYTAKLFDFKKLINSKEVECQVQPPETPQDLSITDKDGHLLTLGWTYPNDETLVSFDVYRDFEPVAQDIKGLTYTDTGLERGTEYCYTVVAVNSKGERSEASGAACGKTLDVDTVAPDMPTGLIAEASSSKSINLSWNASIDDSGIAPKYVVYQSDLTNPIQIVSGTSTDVLGLLSDTNYCFEVAAVDRDGNQSEKSSQACISTLAPEFAVWNMQFGCQNRQPLVDVPVELNISQTSNVSFVGNTNDYDGTPFVFSITGLYDQASNTIDGNVSSAFGTRVRQDSFFVDISTGDSGTTNMTLETAGWSGCLAAVRFYNNGNPVKAQRSPTVKATNGLDNLYNGK
ncbi:TPA: DUF5011 domain-containing protein [Vibrio parahaemolyticus]|uniref:immunoglobulin-like domain-containing protein n=1 Tax=Vibrio parahaemolyticus TaxID=670 RepID=UPI00111FFFFD|nr:immunoglobulin-like domain-containing protein [Vibrio parahaemolyticus]TOL99617.1 hypothetical protein CGH88_03340 [Vibrio parahaemolyticus]TPA78359.1 DUF5011 domain-containing protein [Vibrio parahaemolyticus]HCG9710666.1 DUF5011 domain-containing protein [Vibrio parahaemolyticus]HCH1148771.1 DUF5011 domain-containing protein [Vibrio parahaemolyticus]HCM1333001.1 DUF5011 domain-containing protein [Vibrio parahaemolyticus]